MVDVVADGQPLPFSAGVLERHLMRAGLPVEDAVPLAERIGALLELEGHEVVDEHELSAIVAEQLVRADFVSVERRLRVRNWIRRSGTPFVIAVGGTSGVGKSTVSARMAARYEIGRVISTDMVRSVVRAVVHPELVPPLHESSFSAEKMFRSNLEGNRLLVAFEQQATMVLKGTAALVRRSLKEGLQVVINGVHIVPGLIDLPSDAVLSPYVLTVANPEEHKRRFVARLQESDRDPQRYLARLDAIRQLDDYITSMATQHDVRTIESRSFEQTVVDLMDAVADDLIRRHAIPFPGRVIPG
jgi:2-phosphoglycerate kinase